MSWFKTGAGPRQPMRRAAIATALLALLLLVAPPGATTAPLTQPTCGDAATPTLFAQWDTQLENLLFFGNALLVSDIGGERLLRFAPGGALLDARDVPGMHGLVVGPDGSVYAGASGEGGIEVWRFDGGDPVVVATGLSAANGMAFDAEGNLFVSSPLATSAPYLVRLPAGDMAAWEPWGDEYGTNGLWTDGDSLLSAITADQSSRIVRISTSDPSDVEIVAELSFGAATLQPGAHAPSGQPYAIPKGLDDLTLGPDGMIYVVGHVSGELLRVDPATGAACVLAAGFEEPTSVRYAADFGEHSGSLFVTDMGGAAVSALVAPGAGAVWALPIG